MAKLFPYIGFANAKECINYYQEVFNAKVISHQSVPEEMAKEFGVDTTKIKLEDTTMHSIIEVYGAMFMCSDQRDVANETSSKNITLLLDFNSEDEEQVKQINELYESIEKSKSATIEMPLSEQFWGGKMAALVDKYGIRWMLHSQPYSKM